MNFQTHYDRYLQNIHRTQNTGEATPELSLYPHLQAFLEKLFIDLGRNTVTLTQEPRQLDQIGRPDETYGTAAWPQYINAQLVKRIFGFELLVAPYTIAHLKLSLFLQAQGWHANERLRIYLTNTWQHVFVTNRIIGNCISNKDGPTHVFPLYLYPNPEEFGISTERSLNLKPAFLAALSEALELPQSAPFNLPEGVSPEEILAYIYAILYSPTYRQRYYDFLKYDFPRIPLPQDIDQFRTLAAFGQRLVDAHLLKDVSRPEGAPTSHRFEGEGDGVVEKARYLDGRVWINPTQYFTDVSEEVWEYEIGAYQVCEKWLKDRRGETLRHEDVRQYRSILVAIAETLAVMAAIDEVLEF